MLFKLCESDEDEDKDGRKQTGLSFRATSGMLLCHVRASRDERTIEDRGSSPFSSSFFLSIHLNQNAEVPALTSTTEGWVGLTERDMRFAVVGQLGVVG